MRFAIERYSRECHAPPVLCKRLALRPPEERLLFSVLAEAGEGGWVC